MSRETTLARGLLRAADSAWAAHTAHCPACKLAARARARDKTCDDGADLLAARTAAAAEVRENAELDRRPIPGQQTLL